MDDILKRLGNVETAVSEVRTQVGSIAAAIPHLATKADLTSMEASISEFRETIPRLATEASVSELRAIIPHLATKADLLEVKASLASMETAVIKWTIATVLTSTALAFSIAKFVH